jgi:hypothetical protein
VVNPVVNPEGSPVHPVVNPAKARRAVPAVRAAVPAAKAGLAKWVVFQAADLKDSRLLQVKPVVVVAVRTGRPVPGPKPRAAVAIKRVPTAMEIVMANLVVIVVIPALCPAG